MNSKPIAILLFTLLIACTKSFSQDAKIYFMRLTGNQGSLTAFRAFIDGDLVCRLNNGRYSVHEILPGNRKISVQMGGREVKNRANSVMIDIEPGKTYYVLMFIQPAEPLNDLFVVEVTEKSAITLLPRMLKDAQCLTDKDKRDD